MGDVQKKVGTGRLLGVCEALPIPAPTPKTLALFPTKFIVRVHLQPGKGWLGQLSCPLESKSSRWW